MAGNSHGAFPVVHEDALLKAYGLTTPDPASWHDTNAQADDMTAETTAHLDIDTDPLGLRYQMPAARDITPELRTQISLSSKTFDPKAFLSTVHPDATFADLSHGVAHLKESVEGRSAALKVLVQDNFDRFVAVKATTDGVHREMKEAQGGPLREEAGYGVNDLKKILSDASARADQVFMPVLENNLKAIKLRSTLGVFERSKFFFNLPGSLHENIEAERYEVALRDYKKGKYLLESRPGQLLAFSSSTIGGDADLPGNAKQQAQQRRILAKVWDAVEANRKEMQEKLLMLLKEPRRSVEEQEKTIDILNELGTAQDPVSVYLESQRGHIRSLMQKSYDSNSAKVDNVNDQLKLARKSKKDRARDIQECLRQLQRGGEPSYNRMIGATSWKAIQELVRHLCETILQTLPSFWKVAKNYQLGKFGKGKVKDAATTERMHAQHKAWAKESFDFMFTYFSQFFTLTDISIAAQQKLSPLPDWVCADTCSLTAAHFMRAILVELSDAVNEIATLGVGSASSKSLQNMVENVRFKFTEVLCNLWQNDSKLMYMLEDWTLNPDEDATTLYLRDLVGFDKANARSAYHIAGGVDKDDGESGSQGKPIVPKSEFTGRIKDAFLDALYGYLDGLVHLAFSEYDPLEPTMTTSQKVVADSRLTVDVQELDTRILLTVTNIAHLNKTVIPGMMKQFQDAYQVSMTEDRRTLEEVAQQLDGILFSDYVKRKGSVINSILSQGILAIQWQSIPKPSEVHPFVYESLLSLVQVHAQVRAVAKRLVTRTLTALLEDLAKETLAAFEQVSRFGMGGMLQATLEIEFIHQTLNQYVSPAADETLKRIYETISRKYSSSSSAAEADTLKAELDNVKRTLVASRKATALEFLCFRRPRPREASGATADASTGSKSVRREGSMSSSVGGGRRSGDGSAGAGRGSEDTSRRRERSKGVELT